LSRVRECCLSKKERPLTVGHQAVQYTLALVGIVPVDGVKAALCARGA